MTTRDLGATEHDIAPEHAVAPHPIAAAFPTMDGAEFAALVEDIRSNGQREPIALYEGLILDGVHRASACWENGLPVRAVRFAGTFWEACRYAISANVHRRHLTPSQKAMVGEKLATLDPGRPEKTGPGAGLTQEEAAEAVGASEREVRRARYVVEHGTPEEVAAVVNGTATLKPTEQAIRSRQERLGEQQRQRGVLTYGLAEWAKLPAEERASIIAAGQAARSEHFNAQKTDFIKWAQWSWNPVTGCKHDCPYCYARDIAKKLYPQGFAPTFLPARLGAPHATKVPERATNEIAYRNVFTCSMADLFGRWVPSEWIAAVLDVVKANPQWNFLFLTKFPKRYTEFTFPDNAWIGATVDCQARVASTEDAFAHVNAGVKWLSIEPMLEPLRFKHLDLFNWIVLGGASPSEESSDAPKTPEWRVPTSWWVPLHAEALRLGIRVFHKTNLYRIEERWPGDGTPDHEKAPTAFEYLKAKGAQDIVRGEA